MTTSTLSRHDERILRENATGVTGALDCVRLYYDHLGKAPSADARKGHVVGLTKSLVDDYVVLRRALALLVSRLVMTRDYYEDDARASAALPGFETAVRIVRAHEHTLERVLVQLARKQTAEAVAAVVEAAATNVLELNAMGARVTAMLEAYGLDGEEASDESESSYDSDEETNDDEFDSFIASSSSEDESSKSSSDDEFVQPAAKVART